jgi:excisionase family DNA binding protein
VIEQCDDSVTLTGAPTLAAAYRATLCGIRARRADGLPFGDLQELARALRRAHDASRKRHEFVPDSDTSPSWGHQQSRDDWCTTGEAAALLGLSRRSVQRMARAPGGLDAIRVGRTYLLRSAPLLVLAERRARDRRAHGISV